MFGCWDRAVWVLVKFVFSYTMGFRKIRGVLFGGPCQKDSNTLGSILESHFILGIYLIYIYTHKISM